MNTLIITIIILFIVSIICAFFVVKFKNSYKKKCTYKVSALVVDFAFIQGESNASADDPYAISTFGKFPRYKYTYNGNEYEVIANIDKNFSRVKIGDLVTLFINPDNPEQFYAANEKNYYSKYILTVILTIIIFFLIIYLAYCFICK